MSRLDALEVPSIQAHPRWARWQAVDRDGSVWAYAERPEADVTLGRWQPPRWALDDRTLRLGNVGGSVAQWRHSLVELESLEEGEREAAAIVIGIIVVFIVLACVARRWGWT